jgi:predicted nucleic acid-binding protein
LIVVDASVLVTALADDGNDGDRARARLRDERLVVPHLTDLEVVSAWRRMVISGALDERRARLAIADLQTFPLHRAPHAPLLDRCWQLRSNLSVYDAVYVTLAEATGLTLVTADRRLAESPGLPCSVELLS